GRRL
ncbi:hypothetical protein CP09DC78_0722B, partial [Chlamydia psittaci 09DC78]